MKITGYSKDVDILIVRVADEPVDYAEDTGQFVVHFSKDGKPVLLEIQGAKDFVMESYNTLFAEDQATSVP
ncbi:MAG: DUF2283 domain-containing protein [Chloroflexi bacterium]|nr:DUF2283 domain-containing protein [Chloroflexota bacterium]